MFGIIRIMNLKASSILSHRVYDLGVPFGGSLISCCWMVESNSLTSCCDLLEKGLFQLACIHSLAAPSSCNLWACVFFNPWEWVVGIASNFCGLQSNKDSLKLKSLRSISCRCRYNGEDDQASNTTFHPPIMLTYGSKYVGFVKPNRWNPTSVQNSSLTCSCGTEWFSIHNCQPYSWLKGSGSSLQTSMKFSVYQVTQDAYNYVSCTCDFIVLAGGNSRLGYCHI